MAKKSKLQKRKNPQVGDVHYTTNQRLDNYHKKGKNNSRMAVITSKTKDKQTVNAIFGVKGKSKADIKKAQLIEIDKDKNKFLSKRSAVSLKKYDDVYSKNKEIKQGKPKKVSVNVNDRNVFEERKGKLHWKDKKKLKKALK